MICPQASIIFIPINFLLLVYLMVLNIMHIHNFQCENVTVKGPCCHVQIHRISKKYIMYGILVHDINSLYINVGVLIGVYISI